MQEIERALSQWHNGVLSSEELIEVFEQEAPWLLCEATEHIFLMDQEVEVWTI